MGVGPDLAQPTGPAPSGKLNSACNDRSSEHRDGWCKAGMENHLRWWGSVVVLVERTVSSLAVAMVEVGIGHNKKKEGE